MMGFGHVEASALAERKRARLRELRMRGAAREMEAEVAAIRVKAEGGDAVAMRRLGFAYRDGKRGLKKDRTGFHAELKTSKLTPVNDGHSVKLGMVTQRGNFVQLMELDGLAINRDDALLVVNEAKLSPSDKDIDDTEVKKWMLVTGCGTRRRRRPSSRRSPPKSRASYSARGRKASRGRSTSC